MIKAPFTPPPRAAPDAIPPSRFVDVTPGTRVRVVDDLEGKLSQSRNGHVIGYEADVLASKLFMGHPDFPYAHLRFVRPEIEPVSGDHAFWFWNLALVDDADDNRAVETI